MLDIRPLAETGRDAFEAGTHLAPYLARLVRRAPQAYSLLQREGATELAAHALKPHPNIGLDLL